MHTRRILLVPTLLLALALATPALAATSFFGRLSETLGTSTGAIDTTQDQPALMISDETAAMLFGDGGMGAADIMEAAADGEISLQLSEDGLAALAGALANEAAAGGMGDVTAADIEAAIRAGAAADSGSGDLMVSSEAAGGILDSLAAAGAMADEEGAESAEEAAAEGDEGMMAEAEDMMGEEEGREMHEGAESSISLYVIIGLLAVIIGLLGLQIKKKRA